MSVPKVRGKERKRRMEGAWRRKRCDTGCIRKKQTILDWVLERVGL